MSYVKIKGIWYKNNTLPVTFYGISKITTSENYKPQNNVCTVDIIDPSPFYSNGTFLPKEGDKIVIYGKIVTDNISTDFTSDDVLWTGKFIDYAYKLSFNKKVLQLRIGDWTYDVFNRFFAKSFIGLGMRTNEIIEYILKTITMNREGLGTTYLDFTNVASTRPDGSPFPIIEPVFINKPVIEWIQELSTPKWTADVSDDPPVMVYDMIFKIKDNAVYWYYPTSAVIKVIDSNYLFDEIIEKSSNEGSVNRLILECGEDFNGEPIYTYIYNISAEADIIKEKYLLIQKIGGINKSYDNAYHLLRQQYDINTNTEFRQKVRELAEKYADYWFKHFGQSKLTIKMSIPYQGLQLGDIVTINLPNFTNTTFKVINVSNTFTEKKWSQTLELEELIGE